MTEIKRLKQSGKDFAPITLSEAVVVNTNVIPGLSNLGITTLDKVLGAYGLTFQQFMTALAGKQDELTAGAGITINKVTVGDETKTVIGLSSSVTTLYKIVTVEQFNAMVPGPEHVNYIYIYPSANANVGPGNYFTEVVCMEMDDPESDSIPKAKKYFWEKIGELPTEVDLSNYLTWDKYVADGGIIAVPVTTSLQAGNKAVIVSYDIPANLYDDVVGTEVPNPDNISSPSGDITAE